MEQRDWFCSQVKACEPAMYRLAMGLVGNEYDAADAAQEAICAAYQKLNTLRNRERFKPWLLRIVTNQCYDILRQRRRFAESDAIPEPEAPGPEQRMSDVWEAVNDLNEQMRAVVILFYYEDLSVREIAAVLRISEANVKTRLSRARKRLREMLEVENHEL